MYFVYIRYNTWYNKIVCFSGDTVVSHRGEIGITTTWFHSGCSNSSIQCTIPSSAKG